MRGLVLAIAAVVLVARPASASPEEEAAQVHLDRGLAAFNAKNYAVAHEEFTESSKLAPTQPNPYRWLALTEVQLGDCARAQGNIDAFLARVAKEDARREEMLRLRDLCTRTGTLAIRTTPEKAQLRIDGARVGASPFRGTFAVGDHTVVAEAPGYASSARDVALVAGATVDVHLELARPRAATPITKRWWFIPAIAGVAVVAAGGIYLATRGDDATPMLPGVICDASGCHPGGT